MIQRELTSDDSEVRAEYLALFEPDTRVFSQATARAACAWQTLDQADQGRLERAHVSALVHAAMSLHIVSFKLLLSGHMAAAGNISRQVIETIALALLCSSKQLDVLKRFKQDHYSGKDAVRDVRRHAAGLPARNRPQPSARSDSRRSSWMSSKLS